MSSAAGKATFWLPAMLLGLATIGSYGVAYYSIGVLLPEIAVATGWRTTSLAGAYSLGVFVQGFAGLAFGRLLDQYGSKVVLLPALLAGCALLLLASEARESWQFALSWGAGAALLGGGLFYNVTMPMTARLYAENRAGALSVLTLLGALASPIFYPLAAWLLSELSWRHSLQALTVLMAMAVLPAALVVRSSPPSRATGVSTSSVFETLRQPPVYKTLLAFGLASFATSALLLHQVPAMHAAGLSLAAASGFAGLRGLFQIPGRLLMPATLSRFALRGSIIVCYASAITATLALMAGGIGFPTGAAVYFAVVGGMSLGMLSPLNGLLQVEVYGEERLGTLAGVGAIVTAFSASAGAGLAGAAVDATGSYWPMLAGVALIQVLAITVLNWQRVSSQAIPVHVST